MLYIAGYYHIALVVCVLAVVSLIAVSEAQLARWLAGKVHRSGSTLETLRSRLAAKQATIDRQAAALEKKDAQIAQLKTGASAPRGTS